jgi:hypothetical protein
MPPRPKGPDGGALSRKRTADLLRQLREAEQKARMLKADIEAAKRADSAADEARRHVIRRRR